MQELKDFVAAGRPSRKISDELVEMIVADWPGDVDNLRREVAVRLKARMRQKYGSVLATILFYVIAEYVMRAVLNWLTNRGENRRLIGEWHRAAAAKGI